MTLPRRSFLASIAAFFGFVSAVKAASIEAEPEMFYAFRFDGVDSSGRPDQLSFEPLLRHDDGSFYMMLGDQPGSSILRFALTPTAQSL